MKRFENSEIDEDISWKSESAKRKKKGLMKPQSRGCQKASALRQKKKIF